MNNDYYKGKTATWCSQAGGYQKEKTGEILAYIPAGSTLSRKDMPADCFNKYGQLKYGTRVMFDGFDARQEDRLLVKVPHGKSSHRYYLPRLKQVNVK